jgi:hypothetical protein
MVTRIPLVAAVASVALALAFTALTVALQLGNGGAWTPLPLAGLLVVSGGAILYSLTGALIVWRRRAHRLGLLMLVAGPLYALLNLGWTTGDALRPVIGRDAFAVYQLFATWGSWPGVAIIAGWIPLLFPTGSLPSRAWRLPAAVLAGVGTARVLAGMLRRGPFHPELAGVRNPIGIDGWPPALALLRALDRRFDRARYDGERVAAAYADRLRDEVNLDALRASLVHVAGASLRPAVAGLWLRRHGGQRP